MLFVFLDLGLFIHYDNLFSCSTRGSLFLPKRQKLSEIKRQHFLEKVVKKWGSVCKYINCRMDQISQDKPKTSRNKS